MKQTLMCATSGGMNPQDLRRAIVGTSLVGTASMGIVPLGLPECARTRPWPPLLAAGLAGAQAVAAAKYLFRQMPKMDKGWCGYWHHRRAGAYGGLRADPAGDREGGLRVTPGRGVSAVRR